MKKIADIFYVSLILILICLVFTELFLYKNLYSKYKNSFEVANKIYGVNRFKLNFFSKPETFDIALDELSGNSPKLINKKYSGKSIIVFGCSYVVSGEIKNKKDKFCYRLSDEFKRPLLNLSVGGSGTQHIYYFLTHEKYLKNAENPEYIIYVFINDHIRRFYMHQIWNPFETIENLRYKIKDGKVEKIKPVFFQFWNLYTIKELQRYISWKNFENTSQEDLFLNFVDFMKEIKKVSSKKYPNAKFAILLYDDKIYDCNKDFINNSDWNLLRKEGFYVFDTKDLTDKDLSDLKYKSDDLYHPNAEAWKEVIPNLVKELKKI